MNADSQRRSVPSKAAEISVLKSRLKGRIVIVGIGNSLRGDDGAGPELIRRLRLSLPPAPCEFTGSPSHLLLIDAGEVPENYLQKIAEHKPDTVLLVDAVDFQSSPGSVRIIEQEDVRSDTLSTHNASLKLVMDFLKKETEADIMLLGIQPENISMGSGLSEPVKQALDKVGENLVKCMS